MNFYSSPLMATAVHTFVHRRIWRLRLKLDVPVLVCVMRVAGPLLKSGCNTYTREKSTATVALTEGR